ncbi:hypothetical protein HYALB_00008728 [Hymenoscyphus albidus]|uniref:Autophagy-related protein 16 domain-containing protein n=1 Tax=Hymenoscyphus albidus TaxID=595503 RepID=A0A9N9Q8C3_9HELO|nr:hypothetical protein HYALB_00008728 [Hymenoscyphus albidus]
MASTSWRTEYTQSLHDRDERQKASYARIDNSLINAFTDLLARTSALEAEKAATAASQPTPSPSTSNSALKPLPPSKRTGSDSPTTDPSAVQLKSDLAQALLSNTTLQTRLKNAEAALAKVQTQSKSDSKALETVTRERNVLSQKVRDRDEELRGKARLLDEVQDEVLSLNLQLNMSEQTIKKLKTENKELIDRWLAYKGREAEAMNNAL